MEKKIQAKCYGVWGFPYYRTESGAHLDPGESCDCEKGGAQV